MGRRIDRIALNAVCAIALYLFFASAFHSIPAAIVSAFCAMMLLHKLFLGLSGRMPKLRQRRKRAHSTLERWVRMDEEEADKQLRALLEKVYPDEVDSAEIELIVKHPQGAPLDLDMLLNVWKLHNHKSKRLILACTAQADAKAVTYARTLEAPTVRLLDASQLIELLMKCPPPEEKGEPEIPRKRTLTIAASRDHAPRRLLFGLLLLVMYILLGNVLYLAASLITLLFAGLGFKKKPVPKKLFE